MTVDLGAYKPVAQRMAEFFAKHPEGSLRPLDPARPFWFETIGASTFLVYAAVAMRGEGDQCPGVGMAWEPCPGKTSFTRDSELQNAETSAWGRAIIAAGASDTQQGVASRDEVEARSGAPLEAGIPRDVQRIVRRSAEQRGITSADLDLLVRDATMNRSDDLCDIRPGEEYEFLKARIKAWRAEPEGANPLADQPPCTDDADEATLPLTGGAYVPNDDPFAP